VGRAHASDAVPGAVVRLTIRKRHGGRSIQINTFRTPNSAVLIALLDRIIGVRRQE
jgi:hypothetical protein